MSIYHPVVIMPPDQIFLLYLQMTEGCAFNKCSFVVCLGVEGRRETVRIRPRIRAFRRVRAFMGEGLGMRHSLFLGDATHW